VSFIYDSPLVLMIVIGACVFGAAYLMSDRILNFLYQKTIGQREELYNLMDSLYVETDRKKITISLYLASFGLGAIVFLLMWPNIIFGLIIGTAIAMAGWQLPKILLKNMLEKRSNKVVDQMVDGLTIMANSVKSGLTIQQALERVVENMNGPIAQEFSLILNQIRLGSSVEDALSKFGDRIPRPDVQMFVSGANILKETGGNLTETFQTIVTTIRERQKVEKRIDAMTAQGIMQATIVSCAPAFILIFTYFADPAFVLPLFTRPLGWFLLTLVLGLIITGGVIMKKIVTIKV
jgi:tight adherence protein B